MEGCFTFQWGLHFQLGGFIFKWGECPMGGIGFDGEFSKKSQDGGHPTMRNRA